MNDFTQQVRGSTGEIGTSLQGVRHATERLRGLSQENLEGMEQISRGMSEIVDSVSVLQELGARNSENIQTIEGEVAKFTV
jgi:methyl-accepting chemotaxis protein